jgi:uncharacterized protein (TIGR03435 family)
VIDHPNADATGLSGRWDFRIGWTRAALAGTQPPAADRPAGAVVEAQRHFGFRSGRKRAGLKLVKQKRSIPVIIVDHVDERPIE